MKLQCTSTREDKKLKRLEPCPLKCNYYIIWSVEALPEGARRWRPWRAWARRRSAGRACSSRGTPAPPSRRWPPWPPCTSRTPSAPSTRRATQVTIRLQHGSGEEEGDRREMRALTDWRRLGSEAGSAAAAESRDAAESERRWKS